MNSYLKDPVLACTVSLLLLMTAVVVVFAVDDFLDALRDAEHPRQVWLAIEAPRAGVDCWQHDDTREVVCVDATGCDS